MLQKEVPLCLVNVNVNSHSTQLAMIGETLTSEKSFRVYTQAQDGKQFNI